MRENSLNTNIESPDAIIRHTEHILEKGGVENEDTMYRGSRRFAVFDGATSLGGYRNRAGHTGGYLAAHIAKKVFSGKNLTLQEAALKTNHRIAEAMASHGIAMEQKENRWAVAFAAVDIDSVSKRIEWAQISDSLILVIDKDGSCHPLISDYDHDRETLIHWKQLADNGIGNIREAAAGDIVSVRRRANVTYGVLNGEAEASQFIRTGSAPLENIAHILIFTDGLIIPKENPKDDDDFQTMTALFKQGGLRGIKDYVREIEKTDPECRKYPRFKKSDDIAAIALSF